MNTEIECEILQLSNDGEDLSPTHLKLIENSVNFGLNEQGKIVLDGVLKALKDGTYKAPWLLGVKGMTQDHEGYIYYHGAHVEHYTNRYFKNEAEIKEKLEELKKRCETLKKNGLQVSCGNAIWLWNKHDFQLDEETLKAIEEEIVACYEPKDMEKFATFSQFFDAEDVRNAYEEEWDADKYRPYYEKIWRKIKGTEC